MASIDQILQERGKTHGNYTDHARITQSLKAVISCELLSKQSLLGVPLHFDQLETLDMISHKIGRIVAGDPNVEDHWRDIAGYATLVAERLAGEQEPK